MVTPQANFWAFYRWPCLPKILVRAFALITSGQQHSLGSSPLTTIEAMFYFISLPLIFCFDQVGLYKMAERMENPTKLLSKSILKHEIYMKKRWQLFLFVTYYYFVVCFCCSTLFLFLQLNFWPTSTFSATIDTLVHHDTHWQIKHCSQITACLCMVTGW